MVIIVGVVFFDFLLVGEFEFGIFLDMNKVGEWKEEFGGREGFWIGGIMFYCFGWEGILVVFGKCFLVFFL